MSEKAALRATGKPPWLKLRGGAYLYQSNNMPSESGLPNDTVILIRVRQVTSSNQSIGSSSLLTIFINFLFLPRIRF